MVAAFDAQSRMRSLDAIFELQPLAMLFAAFRHLGAARRGRSSSAASRCAPPRDRCPRIYAALLTAALFSLMHLDPVGALGLFEIGFWLAVLRWGSGSILPAMLGHALNNAVAGCWFLLGLQSAGRPTPAWAVTLGIDNPDAPPPLWVLLVEERCCCSLLGVYLGDAGSARPSDSSPQPQMEGEDRRKRMPS